MTTVKHWGRDGAVVRALASHQCVTGSIHGPGVVYGLSLLLVLYSAPRGFSQSGYSGFLLSSKPKIFKFQFVLQCTGISEGSLVNSLVLMGKHGARSCELPGAPWHLDCDILDLLNKRILQFISETFNSDYNNLLNRAGIVDLKNKRLQNMIVIIFKCLHFLNYPIYLKDMFHWRYSN